MAKRQVVVSTCDRCGREETTDFNKAPVSRAEEFLLPEHWLHVAGNTRKTTVFSMDLCGECKMTVLEAAGAADR